MCLVESISTKYEQLHNIHVSSLINLQNMSNQYLQKYEQLHNIHVSSLINIYKI